MKTKQRPQLKVGDIVRVSKKGKQTFQLSYLSDAKLIVCNIETKDGVEKNSQIKCRTIIGGVATYLTVSREYLWATHRNINQPTIDSPANNDGRTLCFKCGTSTKLAGNGIYSICPNSACVWFKN